MTIKSNSPRDSRNPRDFNDPRNKPQERSERTERPERSEWASRRAEGPEWSNRDLSERAPRPDWAARGEQRRPPRDRFENGDRPRPQRGSGLIAELREGGRLSDIAPTMLDIMNIEKPDVMSGSSLIIK